jgi:uncharacterized protein YegP (UPF0339 family)
MTAKFVLHPDGKDRYLILLQTHSGQVLLTSEVQYKDIALRRISATRSLARNDKIYLLCSEGGSSYFAIKNAAGEILALSDMYPDEVSLREAINQVKRISHGARLEDLTLPPKLPKHRRTSGK